MNPRVRAIVGVSFMSVLLVLYFALAGVKAFALLGSGDVVAVIMGAALIVFPIIGVWALGREIAFGFRSTSMVDALAERGELPEELVDVEVTRAEVRNIADSAFPRYRAEVEERPDSWESSMRLGLIYDAAGDRKRARSAIRQAISLKRD